MTFEKIINQPFLSFVIVAVTMIFCLLYWQNNTDLTIHMVTDEQGFIQRTTNILYEASILFAFYCTWRNKRIWPVTIVLILFLCREMDLHKAYNGLNILKSRHYLNPVVPLQFKIFGGIVLAALGIFTLYLLSYTKSVIKALRARASWAVTVVIIIVSLGVAKNLDGLNRKLKDFNLHVNDAFPTLAEESLELIVPAMISLAIGQFLLENYSKRKEEKSD